MYSYLMASVKLPRPRLRKLEICEGLFNHSNCRGNWTADEDKTIIDMQALYGNKWTMIMSFLPGRTKYSVRNRWHVIKRHTTASKKGDISETTSVPNLPTQETNNEYELHSTASISATRTALNSGEKIEVRAYADNAAKKVAASEPIPTHKLGNKTNSSYQDPSSRKFITATGAVDTVNFGELEPIMIHETNNERKAPSIKSAPTTQAVANVNLGESEPSFVVTKNEVMAVSKGQAENINSSGGTPLRVMCRPIASNEHIINLCEEDALNDKYTIQSPFSNSASMITNNEVKTFLSKGQAEKKNSPDGSLLKLIDQPIASNQHVINLCEEDSLNDEYTIHLSPFSNSASMTINDDEEEEMSIDDPSFAYAVAYAASLINAEDSSWQSITDDNNIKNSAEILFRTA